MQTIKGNEVTLIKTKALKLLFLIISHRIITHVSQTEESRSEYTFGGLKLSLHLFDIFETHCISETQ
jgi:hypothetical protein